MDQHDDSNPTSYPLGRGYGHDYMRGGEVFGGYGYRDREDYVKARDGEIPPLDDDEIARLEAAASAAGRLTELRPQRAPERRRAEHGHDRADRPSPATDDDTGPVPQLEHTYGDSGNASRYSRSFYVTQAQLQQRIYAVRHRGEGPYRARIASMQRTDDEIAQDVHQALFHDTWVDAERIAIEVEDGIVTMRGDLPSTSEVRMARHDAWSVPGVRDVYCDIRVFPREDAAGVRRLE